MPRLLADTQSPAAPFGVELRETLRALARGIMGALTGPASRGSDIAQARQMPPLAGPPQPRPAAPFAPVDGCATSVWSRYARIEARRATRTAVILSRPTPAVLPVARDLEKLGYHVEIKAEASEVLAQALAPEGGCALLVVDLDVMPGRDMAWAQVMRLRRAFPRVPILTLSGAAMPLAEFGPGCGAAPVALQKPLSPGALAHGLRAAAQGASPAAF